MSVLVLIRSALWTGCVCAALAATTQADELVLVAGGGKGPNGGPASAASLDGVASLFFNTTHTKLYLGGFSSVVCVLDMQTGVIDTIKGLPGGRSIAIDSKGNIYVAGGSTLRVRRPDGTIDVASNNC